MKIGKLSLQTGFTLIEVLISLALLSLLLGLLYNGLNAMTITAQRSAEKISRSDEVRGAYQFLRSQLTQVVPLSERREDGLTLHFAGYPDRIAFTGSLPAHRGGGGLHFMEIQVQAEVNTLVLFSKLAWPGESLARTPGASGWDIHPLLENVEDMTLSYFGQRTSAEAPGWHDQWLTPAALPKLIRLELAMENQTPVPALTIELHRLNVAGQAQWVW